ncbi:MAG: efflux RND transporter periplasmic adaptor subunit [Candidatus Paceibacterota bacterium]|jgi:HlyD family secretion protein
MQSLLNRLAFPGWRYALAALIVLAAGGYFFFGRSDDSGATFVVISGDFRQQVNVSGAVIAARDVDLGFAANGRISGTYASVGQRVFAGAVIAETENGDLVAALTQKRSALTEAEADLSALRAGTRGEELAIASASVVNAQAALVDAVRGAYTSSDDAIHNKTDTFFTNPRIDPKLSFNVSNASLKTTVERDRTALEPVLAQWALLVGALSSANAASAAKQSQTFLAQVTTFLADANAAINQGVPDSTVTAATLTSYGTTLATARSNVNAAATTLTTDTSALNSAERNLALKQAGSTSEDIAAQEAAVAAAAADVEQARAALAKTRVVAPFTGIITRMDAKVGEIVSPSTSLISMQSDGIFQIETYVPEVSIARVVVGNRATTTLDAYGSAIAFPATVVAVDPAETMKDGVPAYKTTLAFLTADQRIRSGMTVNVVIETGVLRDAIVIPAGAVGTKDGASYVSVSTGDTIVPRPVTTGPAPALGQAQILSGLSSGDVILLSPAP